MRVQGLAPRALLGFECGVCRIGSVVDESCVFQQLPLDIRTRQMDIHLRHCAILLPAGDKPELHLGEPLLLTIAPGQIGEPRMADRVRVNRFRHPKFPGDILQLVLNRPDTHAPRLVPIPPGGHEEWGVCVRTEWVHIDPGLDVRHGADQTEPPHPGLAVDDHHRTIAVELDVADVEAKEFPDPGAGVPHEHDQRSVARLVAGVDKPDNVLAGDKLLHREVPAGLLDLDVLKEIFLASRGEPAEEEFHFENVPLDRERAAVVLSFNDVVLQLFPGDRLCIDEVQVLKERIDAPEFCPDGLLFELLEAEPSDVAFKVLAVDGVQRFHLVEFVHCSITPPGAGN